MPLRNVKRAGKGGVNMDTSVPSQGSDGWKDLTGYLLNLSWFRKIETVRGGVSGPASAPSNWS